MSRAQLNTHSPVWLPTLGMLTQCSKLRVGCVYEVRLVHVIAGCWVYTTFMLQQVPVAESSTPLAALQIEHIVQQVRDASHPSP